jgi:hypothetical protein
MPLPLGWNAGRNDPALQQDIWNLQQQQRSFLMTRHGQLRVAIGQLSDFYRTSIGIASPGKMLSPRIFVALFKQYLLSSVLAVPPRNIKDSYVCLNNRHLPAFTGIDLRPNRILVYFLFKQYSQEPAFAILNIKNLMAA